MPSSMPPETSTVDFANLLDQVAAYPEFAKVLSDFRRKALAILDRNVTELIGRLGEEDRDNARAALLNSANIHQLTTLSRRTTNVVKSRRKVARDILSAGLHNQHNPAWKMTESATYQSKPDDLIVLLMQRPDPLRR